jgi:hypothetical protein
MSRHPVRSPTIRNTEGRSLLPTNARAMDSLLHEILLERAKLAQKEKLLDSMLSPIPCPSALILSVLCLRSFISCRGWGSGG